MKTLKERYDELMKQRPDPRKDPVIFNQWNDERFELRKAMQNYGRRQTKKETAKQKPAVSVRGTNIPKKK